MPGTSEVHGQQPRSAILLLADGHVGAELAQFLLSNYREDLLGLVVRPESDLIRLALQYDVKPHIHDADSSVAARLPKGISLGVAAGWRAIIKEPLLSLPSHGFVNLHPGLLPQVRGKNPNFWTLVEDQSFGVTLHKVDAGIDTGPILAQKRIAHDWTDTGGSFYAKAIDAMVALFKEAYPSLRGNRLPATDQGPGGSTHFRHELDPASRIDLDRSYTARELLNLLRARTFEPHPACCFEADGETFDVRVRITRRSKPPLT